MNNSSVVVTGCQMWGPEEPETPRALLIFSLVHCYCVMIVGTLGSGVALWCVVTCKKTQPGAKVLLGCVFLPVLVICLVTRAMAVPFIHSLLSCDHDVMLGWLIKVIVLSYSMMAQTELIAIAVVAIVRTVVVWSPHRRGLEMRTAVIIVATIILYSLATCLGLLGSLVLGWVTEYRVKYGINVLYFFLNVMLPCLITATCYTTMIVAVRLKKRQLGVGQQQKRAGGVVDQATRAMLAVFFSNFLLGFPHAIYHLMRPQPHYIAISIHLIFYTHFMVDPLVFIWFNNNHRERVCARVRWLLRPCCSTSTTTSPSTPHPPSTSSPSITTINVTTTDTPKPSTSGSEAV